MTNFPFVRTRTLGTAAFQFFLSFSVNALGVYGAHAEQLYHCPRGQIYRVTKKLCVQKSSKVSSLIRLPAAGRKLVAKKGSSAQNNVGGPAGPSSAPRISFLNGFSAVAWPATSDASSRSQNQLDHPEYGALSTSLEPPVASALDGSPLARAYNSKVLGLAVVEAKLRKTLVALGPGLDELGISVGETVGPVGLDGPVGQSEAPDATANVAASPISTRSSALRRAAAGQTELAMGIGPQAQTEAALRDDREIASAAPRAYGEVIHPRVIDASEGTALDPLRNKTYDLNTAKVVPSMNQLDLPN